MPRPKKYTDEQFKKLVYDCCDQLKSKSEIITSKSVRSILHCYLNKLLPVFRSWCEENDYNPTKIANLKKKGCKQWNEGLTKVSHPQLARPGNGQHFLENGKPWNFQKPGYNNSRLGSKLPESWKERLRGFKPGRFIGERHWKWSGGKSQSSWRGSDWSSWKIKIIARDEVCQRCGVSEDQWIIDGKEKKKNLSVHHILAWPVGRNSFDNLVLICTSCHMTVEANKNENEVLKDKIHQKYGYGKYLRPRSES